MVLGHWVNFEPGLVASSWPPRCRQPTCEIANRQPGPVVANDKIMYRVLRRISEKMLAETDPLLEGVHVLDVCSICADMVFVANHRRKRTALF